jgi:hypothetical protein
MIDLTAKWCLILVCSTVTTASWSADEPKRPVRIAAISTLAHAAASKPQMHVAMSHEQSHQSHTVAFVTQPATNPAKQNGTVRRVLDLQSMTLPPVQTPDSLQATAASDSDDPEAITVVAPPSLPPMTSGTAVSHAGLGSLYWAARNPSEAWRVLLPIQPRDGSGASEDLREKCAIFARAPGSPVACP